MPLAVPTNTDMSKFHYTSLLHEAIEFKLNSGRLDAKSVFFAVFFRLLKPINSLVR